MTPAPTYLSDPIAIEEWVRVCAKYYATNGVPDEVLGPLAIYCGIHGSLAGAIQARDIGILVKLAPLVGQYRTLAAALFGRGSARQQPGKNPFADLKGRKPRALPIDATKKCRACFQGWRGFTVCRECNGSKRVPHYAAAVSTGPQPSAKRKGRNSRK